MTPPMHVSVVVPAYNAAGTLPKTIESLTQQTFAGWEAVVVDDGSTDATAEVVRTYAGGDERIRLISQPNGGEAAARNTGVREARYDWLLFLDADDWIAPAHLQRMTAALSAHAELDAVHCRSVRVAPDGTEVSDDYDPPAGDLFPTLAMRAAFPVHACVVRRALVEAVGLFDTTLRKSADWDLWQRVARAGARFGAVREVLAYYRMQPASASLEAEQLLRDGLRVLRRGHEADPRVPTPRPEHAHGAPPAQVESQQYYLLCWCAGILIGQSRSAVPLLPLLPGGQRPRLHANAVARCLFEAATLPRCLPRSGWQELWPMARPLVEELLPALEQHSGCVGLARDALQELEQAITQHTPSARKRRSRRWSLRQLARNTAARAAFRAQVLRLRLDRWTAPLFRPRQPRVVATACWSFPVYSQTFVYQELTQLIRSGVAVRFLYAELDTADPLPLQFTPVWRARRRLPLAPAVCDASLAYFTRRMPARVTELFQALSSASGLSPDAVRAHPHVRQAFAFARMAEACGPDYLHSYFFYEGSLFVLVAAFLLGVPRGVSCYADHLLDDYPLKAVPLHLRQSAITIATSDRIRRELLTIAPGTDPARILVKPNGINTDHFPVVDRAAPADGAPFRLVCLSRIEPKKGLVHLVQAVALLRERGIAVEADLIGGVDDSDASRACHEELIDAIVARRLESSVRLAGRRSETEINRYFASAHLFVAPFVETAAGDKDGIPTALLEAMASGLPAVVTDAGSILEVVTDGRDGVVVPQRDAGALAAAIEGLLSDKARRDALGSAGAETIRVRFDARIGERRFHERLRAVLAAERLGP